MNSRQHQSKQSTPRTARARGADSVMNRIADRIDLAIDVLTLGQYGLEQVPEAAACKVERDERPRKRTSSRRRGGCEPTATTGSIGFSWDWPPARRGAASR
ncbi:MAG: hypothetical protein U0R24_11765 [Solirubrobacterales bacterium]